MTMLLPLERMEKKKDVDPTNTSQQCVSTTATNYKRVPVQILCNVWAEAPFQLTQKLLTINHHTTTD